jgi:6-pyruvoyl-tetrahydropterin synthase related domain
VGGSVLDRTIVENQSAEPNANAISAPSLFGMPIIVIMAASLVMVVPFIFWGNPSGHDFEFHMNSWMEVLSQWKQGVIYPGWAGLAHYGYGEARFIFYPPISWTLGAILGALLPWPIVPAAYTWIALTLSGCTMFLLSRTWLSRNDAIFAAAFYAVNPYYLVIIYWRSAFAELLAGALLPLLVMFVLRLNEGRIAVRREVIPLAMVVTAAWLTNIPAAVMVTYSLGLLVLIRAIGLRSPATAGRGLFAVVMGLALAAFYLLPAIYEQKWINIAQVLSPGIRPADNFLFTNIHDNDHDRFNLLVSLVAFSEMTALAGTIVLFRKRKPSSLVARYFVLWSLTSVLLMFPVALLAWKHLPELKFVQLPWRWLLCVNVSFVPLLALAWRQWTMRTLLYVVFLMMLAFVWHRVQQPWWDNTSDIAEMLDDQQTGHGYEGTEEYVPKGTDGYDISQDAPLATAKDADSVQISIQQWNSQSKRFTAETSLPAKLYLRLFNYPAWTVEINGRVTVTETRGGTGQMVIPIQQGVNRVSVTFARTWDRTIGLLISLLTTLLMVSFTWGQRHHAAFS